MKTKTVKLSTLCLAAALLSACALGQAFYDEKAQKVCERTDNREPEACKDWQKSPTSPFQ